MIGWARYRVRWRPRMRRWELLAGAIWRSPQPLGRKVPMLCECWRPVNGVERPDPACPTCGGLGVWVLRMTRRQRHALLVAVERNRREFWRNFQRGVARIRGCGA